MFRSLFVSCTNWALQNSAQASYIILFIGVLASSVTAAPQHIRVETPPPAVVKKEPVTPVLHSSQRKKKATHLTAKVQARYKVAKAKAVEVVHHVLNKTEDKQFPSADLVLAIIAVESSFNNSAVSSAGARGYMQVMRGPTDPSANIDRGIELLREYKDRYKSLPMALEAYNVGPGNLSKGIRNPGYVVKVMAALQELKKA